MAKLGEICAFQSGGTPSKNKPEYFGGEIPWISTTALNGDKINEADAVTWITPKAIRESAAKIVPANSIMIGTRVGIGKVAINTVEMSTSQDVISLINIDEDKWYKPYLCKLLLSKKDYFNSQARGATIKGIKIDVVANIDVPEIDYATQRKVAATLNKIDTLIVLRKHQLEKLDELVKAQFSNTFENNTNFHTDYMENLSEFVTVGIANSATHAYAEHGVVMLRNQNIKENHLDDTELVYIEPKFADKYKSKKLEANDILVTRTGYPGIACVVPQKYAGSQTFTTLIIRLKRETNVSSCYICHYINSSHGKKYVSGTKVGVAQQNFGAKVLAKMPVIVPPIELQNQFATFVARIDQQKQTVQQSLEKLELMKKALMQEYFG